jgi:hypothetical protein
VVANAQRERGAALRALPVAERPVPLLAALDLKLIDEPTPRALDELETDFYELVRAEPDAARRYLAVFGRHWDLDDGPLRVVLSALERWAASYRDLAVVYVQAFHDDAGRVYGGRYFNLWSHTAALPPLETPPFRRRRMSPPARPSAPLDP